MMRNMMIGWMGAFVLVVGMGCSAGGSEAPVFEAPVVNDSTDSTGQETTETAQVDLEIIAKSWQLVFSGEPYTYGDYTGEIGFTMEVHNLFLNGNPDSLILDIYISSSLSVGDPSSVHLTSFSVNDLHTGDGPLWNPVYNMNGQVGSVAALEISSLPVDIPENLIGGYFLVHVQNGDQAYEESSLDMTNNLDSFSDVFIPGRE